MIMIKMPNCPRCGSNTAPDLIEINILDEGTRDTYEEVYECRCGCRFVVLIPRHFNKIRVHRLEHEEKNFCLSTQY